MVTTRKRVVAYLILATSLVACSCSRPAATKAASSNPPSGQSRLSGEVRITGVIQAVHSVKIVVPRLQGQTSMMALTQLIPNGSAVKEGDLIAMFDATPQLDAARDAQAKFEDLGHQADQKAAENRANAETRTSDLRQAEADLAKAELELSKGPILMEIERLKNEARAAGARVHLQSLKKSAAFREKSEAAALRILELQRDRQKIALQRTRDNIQLLEIHAPLAGMVVHELTYRAGSSGHAQLGDQMYRGYPLVSIFDTSDMQVRCAVNEPDVLALLAGRPATVALDAYPGVAIPAHFAYASPVASAAAGTPIKSFFAIFQIDRTDPHLLPDLSAAVVLGPVPSGGVR